MKIGQTMVVLKGTQPAGAKLVLRKWRFNHENLTLTAMEPYSYEVGLERMTTSAEVLDWIIQVQQKSWCTPEHIYELIEAIDFLIGPQSCLCSCGKECGPIDVKKKMSKRWSVVMIADDYEDPREALGGCC